MQQAAEGMKSSQTGIHNKREGSDLNRGRRSGRWGLNVTERKSRTLEFSVRRIGRPIVADIKTQSQIFLQAAAELADTTCVLTKSQRIVDRSRPRQATSVPLPPISRSRAISGKVERTDALPAHRKESAKPKGYSTLLPTGNVMTENTVFHVLVTRGGKVNQSDKYNKISVALAAGNKSAVQDSQTCSRLIKRTFDGQPAATLTRAAVDPLLQQKKNDASDPGAKDSSTVMPAGVKHDASLCKARQQRDFCSDDSAIETESEGSEDKGRPERLKKDSDDEYYTDQRITEWVLKVNSSLFSTGNDELNNSKPAEEQDVATIKIIYSGD